MVKFLPTTIYQATIGEILLILSKFLQTRSKHNYYKLTTNII